MTVKTIMINDTFQSLIHLQCYKWLIVSKRVQNKCKIMRGKIHTDTDLFNYYTVLAIIKTKHVKIGEKNDRRSTANN